MLLFLVYHKVENGAKYDKYSISRKLFEVHLRFVKESGIKVVDPRGMSESWLDHESGLVFTFDDGTVDHFETVLPILREFKIQALFYIPTAKLNKDGYLSEEKVRLLLTEGHAIGSHAHSHKRLDVLPRALQREELENSCEIISGIIGENPIHFAPPGGFYNHEVQRTAQEVGCKFLRTMAWGYNRSFEAMEIEVVPMTNAMNCKLVKSVLNGRGEKLLKLMYLVKNGLRTMLSNGQYHTFQRRVMDKLGKFRSDRME